MSNGDVLSLVCLVLFVTLIPFFVIVAMLSRIRHIVSRIDKSVATLRAPKEVGVEHNRRDQ